MERRELQQRNGEDRRTNSISEEKVELTVGPLPPPTMLADFDRVLPGLAERIVALAEGNAKDRWRNSRAQRIVAIQGQILAFLVVMFALGGGLYLISIDKDVAGIASISTAIAAPLAALVYAKRIKKD